MIMFWTNLLNLTRTVVLPWRYMLLWCLVHLFKVYKSLCWIFLNYTKTLGSQKGNLFSFFTFCYHGNRSSEVNFFFLLCTVTCGKCLIALFFNTFGSNKCVVSRRWCCLYTQLGFFTTLL